MPSSEYNVNINITTKDKTSAAAAKAEKSLLGLSSAAQLVAAGYTAIRLAQKAVAFVKLGAEAKAAEHRLIAFAGGAGQAADYLEALNVGADNTIDRMTGMAQASRMLETDMVRSAYEMEIAGAMVSKLGNQTWSTERRMQSLTLLLANQTVFRLDDFGLSVESVRKRQKELEKQGLSTERAFRAAVFEEASAKLAILGDTSSTAAVQAAQLESAWKTLGQQIAGTVAGIVADTGLLGEVAQWLLDYAEGLNQAEQAAERAGRRVPLGRGHLAAAYEAAAAARTWQGDEEELRRALEEEAAAAEEAARAARDKAIADLEAAQATTRVGYATQGYIRQLHLATASNDELERTILFTISALNAESAALLDSAMSYSAYYQQVGQGAAAHYGTMEDIEARYQKRVTDIGKMGGGGAAAGGAAATEREFDRADIERGLRIQRAQLAEAEAGREAWGKTLLETEPVFWYELAREDRKWLMETGKTLEDLALERSQVGDEITELERAQTDDRIEDLKREISKTEDLLERGHYEQHNIRVAAAQVDTAALLEEARIRRDEEIVILEQSRAQQEMINLQSLGRLELANFDSWVTRNIDTENATAKELEQIELMRMDIALKYGLITADTIAQTTAQWDAWDTLFANIEDSADEAKEAVNHLLSSIQSLPASAGEHWEDVIPIELRQHGGPAKAGMPYIVGERGIEMFVPGSSGHIYNNTQTSQMIGSNNTYNINDPRGMAFLSAAERAAARNAYARASGM